MSGLGDMQAVLGTMLEMGTTFITWCCSTFPINIAIAGSVIGTVIYTVRKGKKIAR